MAKYLLPCDCGKSVSIEAIQAGQTVSCVCGKALEVPALRAIRQLELDEQSETSAEGRRWNATFGAVFAIGCLLIVFGVAIGLISHLQWVNERSQIPTLPTTEETQAWISQVEGMSAVEAWQEWQESKQVTVPPISVHVTLSRHAGSVFRRALIAYGIAATGLLMAAVTVVLGTGRKKQAPSDSSR